MIPLGTIAPDFRLPDVVSGKVVSWEGLGVRKATVMMFICNHCPYVQHIQKQLVTLAQDYQKREIVFVAVNSNDALEYPEDSPAKMKEVALRWKYPFPYLFDESQQVARAYRAECTPDFSVFDAQRRCVYRGQLDDSRPGNGVAVTGRDIRNALDQILKGQPVDSNQKPSVGCNIKWK